VSETTRRSEEISAWLDAHPEVGPRFVVLDDDPCVRRGFPGHHILTDPDVGLTVEQAVQAIRILAEGGRKAKQPRER
jgi:hypothetical protein